MHSIGERICYLRTKKGISMAILAEQIGSTSGTIAYWENNKRLPGAEYIITLSKFFQVSTDWLLRGETIDRGKHPGKMPPILNTIGKRIQHLRMTKGISIPELAKAIGSPRDSAHKWENDIYIPGGKELIATSLSLVTTFIATVMPSVSGKTAWKMMAFLKAAMPLFINSLQSKTMK